MIKPDWKDAPEWANYLAQDECGAWWWYECEPSYCSFNNCWFEILSCRFEEATLPGATVQQSLERRP